MNNLQLKALRQGLGLTVAEASELPSINLTKRSFQRFESGDVPVPSYVEDTFFLMSSHYSLVLDKMLTDVEKAAIKKEVVIDNESMIKKVKPILPFFHTFESFQMATECPHIAYWRIYQSVISQLLLLGKISKLDDAAKIPENFGVWKWLRGAYEHEQLH